MRTLPLFFGVTTSGLEKGDVECCIKPAAKYSSSKVPTCFVRIELVRYERGIIGAVPGSTMISNRSKEHKPKSYLDLESTSTPKFGQHLTEVRYGHRCSAGTLEFENDGAQMQVEPTPHAHEACRLGRV